MKSISGEIEIGSRIQISRKIMKNEEYFKSQILDILDEKTLLISGPIKKSELILIHTGDLINIYYTVENKGVYSYTAKVLSRKNSPIYSLKIERVSDIKRNQQREHFRLFLGVDVKKTHEVAEGINIIEYEEECETKDISGGGMRLYCNYEHKLNDKVRCNFKIENHNIEVYAHVKRIEEIDSFNYKYSIGIAFIDIKEDDRDEIIKYIFEQQRILRNKGLI